MADVPDPVRDASVFGALRPETVEFLLARSTVVEVAAGTPLVVEDEPGGDLYVIRSGRAEVVKQRSSGTGTVRRVRLAEVGAGDCIGEVSFLGILPRNASVVALEDCVAVRFRGSDLHLLYERDPREFAMLVLNLGREAARRLWNANERLLQTLR
jgi:CRP-like cAMP-binding protein